MGPSGDPGQTGPTGPMGPAGVSGYQRIEESFIMGPPIRSERAMTCPAGKSLLSGGYYTFDGDEEVRVFRSGPLDNATWLFTYLVLPNGSGRPINFAIVCAQTN